MDKAKPAFDNPNAELMPNQGRFGAALKFHHKNTSALFFRGETNLADTPEEWSGTVPFWLSLSPSQDLEPGYCDPIQITDTTYNDAAVWVDFTKIIHANSVLASSATRIVESQETSFR